MDRNDQVTEGDPADASRFDSLLAAHFAEHVDVSAAHVFGSRACDDAQPDSDLDVAVLLAEEDPDLRFDFRLRLLGELPRLCGCDADVVVLNDAPPLLRAEVVRSGRLIYESDPAARLDFEVLVIQQHADLAPMRRFFSEALREEIREGRSGGRE